MEITIVYDNEAQLQYKSGWGFACLIETADATIMFDTGARSDILLYNMSELDLINKQIDMVVLSHNHSDHTGGLKGLLSIQPDLKIYKLTHTSEPTELFTGIMTSGALGSFSLREQSLFCTTEKGLVVVTGCSHPGLEKIIRTAQKFGEVHAVIGGFHGFKKFKVLKGISVIVPCHCTAHKRDIRMMFPEAYREGGVGKKFEF